MGYPAAGMRNYLARLGWSHGDDELFTDRTGDGVVRPGRNRASAPARFDFKKLENICGQHIAMSDDAALLHEMEAFLAATGRQPLTERQRAGLMPAMYSLKERAKTLPELIEKAHFILTDRPVEPDEKLGRGAGFGIPWYTERIDAAVAKC